MAWTLRDLFLSHAAGETDKAGISRLELWIAAATEEASLDNLKVCDELITILETVDMSLAGRWASLDELIDRLSLRSGELASAIETATATYPPTNSERAYDEFSAWFAFYHAGGSLTPKILGDQANSLRIRAATHWLDLALVAYEGNDTALTAAVAKMVTEGLLQPKDIEFRYRTIAAALTTFSLTDFLNRILVAAKTQTFAAHLIAWANDRHGIDLGPMPATTPPTSANDNISDLIARIFTLPPARRFAAVLG
jgi:hypothetical protein